MEGLSLLPKKPLSKEEADVLTQLNQRNSPLLRLPAEIRNQIYGYVLGGVTILPLSKPAVLWIRTIGTDGDSTLKITSKAGFFHLLYTCRQLHRETRLLPLQLNTFFFCKSLVQLLEKMSEVQRNAIASVEFGLYLAKSAADTYSMREGDITRRLSQNLREWDVPPGVARLVALKRLKGLKRVIIKDPPYFQVPHQLGEKIIAAVKHYAGNHEIEIEIVLYSI